MKKLSLLIISTITCVVLIGGIPAVATSVPELDESHGIVVSMTVGSSDILVTGEAHTLKNAPFIQNGIPYVPLREMVELCGGLVRYNGSDKSVLISLPRDNSEPNFSQVWIGKQRVLNNASEEALLRDYMYPSGAKDSFVPRLINGSVYVPVEYFERFGFAEVTYNVQSGLIRIDNFDDGNSLGGFILDSDFLSYDSANRNEFKTTGKTTEIDDGALKEETFTNGNLELCIRTGESRYMKWEGTKQEIHMITLVSDKYCTPRGLRVGDSEERFLALYGSAGRYVGRMDVEFNDGLVSRISIFSMD